MSIINHMIVAIMIAIGAFNISNNTSNDMSNDMSIQSMSDDSLNIVEDYNNNNNNNNIHDDEDMTRVDCHDGQETTCLRYVSTGGEDSYWIDSNGNASRVPFIHAAYYMERGSLSMDYYDEWLEAFKAKVCDDENNMATYMADIESMNAGAMSR